MTLNMIGRVAVILVCGHAAAQTPPAEPVKPEPAKAEPGLPPDVLAGPKVGETQTQRSLVRRNLQGRVQRLEMSPDEAAIDLLSLDAATKAKVDKILNERATILDRVVIGNLDLLGELQQTNERRGKLKLLGDFREKLKDLEARGTLREEVEKVLPKEQADRYRDQIDGYWSVVIDDAMQEGKNTSKNDKSGKTPEPSRASITARESLLAFGVEIKRSYERQIAGKTKELEEFLSKLGLSQETEEKIREMYREFFERYRNGSSETQRRDLFQRVFRQLNKEQQKIALAEVLGRPAKKDSKDSPGDVMMPEDAMDGPEKK
ncbi:MAG: hypothetical protein AABZ53_02685 [Planctomycetota bacterium]